MKQTKQLSRSRWLLLTLLSLLMTLGGTSPAWAEELTINNGTGTNSYIPIYGSYADTNGALSEFIIPSSSLSTLNGKEITKMIFYTSSASSKVFTSTFKVYLKEISENSYESSSAFGSEAATVVYTGSLDATGSAMAIEFSNNYVYNGGNLLVGIEVTSSTSNYASTEFYGETQSSYTAFHNKYSATREKFLPKVTFKTKIEGPNLSVLNGTTAISTGFNYNFGLATAGTTKKFTLKNEGTESVSLNTPATTGGFGAELSSTTLAAGGEVTLTVSMADATGDGTVTISSSTNGIEDFTINVSGTVRDPNKVYIDFAGGTMPDGWTTEGYSGYYSYEWALNDGYISYSASSSSYAGKLISPKLNFTNGELIAFETAKYGSSSYSSPSVTVEYTTDATGATGWKAIGSAFTDDVYGTWTKRSVNIPEEGVKRIRFTGWYIHLRNIYGGEVPLNPSPKDLAVSNVLNTSAQLSWTSTASNFNIQYKASGDADWTTLENITDNPHTLTSLSPETQYQVRVQADHGANGLSDYTEAVAFTTKPNPISVYPYTENFNSLSAGEIPANWDNSEGTTTTADYKWSYNSSYGTGHEGKCVRFDSYNNNNGRTNFLKTRPLNFTQGQPMKLTFWWKNPKGGDFSVYASTDGGETYPIELATALTNQTDWVKKEISIPESVYGNNVVIVFKGTSNCGSGDARIYLDDFEVSEISPYAMSISGEDLSENTIAFGTVKNTTTTKSFTISNDGTEALNNVSVVSSNSENFTVSETGFDIPVGETKDITITFVKAVANDYNETVTVSQTNIATPIVLTVTATYVEPTPATLTAKIGEDEINTDGTTEVNFGTIGKTKSKTFTITNTGEATLNITSITSSNTTDFSVEPASLTIEENEVKEFIVSFNFDSNALNEEKSTTITITPSNAGLNPISFTVKGTRDNLWSEDFEGENPLNGWENSNFTVKATAYLQTNADATALPSKFAVANYSSTASTLISPLLEATAEDKLSFDAYFAWGDETLKVEWSTDKNDWHTDAPLYNYDKLSYSAGSTHNIEINAPITGRFYLRFSATYSNAIDNIEGFKLVADAPEFKVFADSETATAGSPALSMNEANDFGFVDEQQTVTYVVKNTGTGGTLSLPEPVAEAPLTATISGKEKNNTTERYELAAGETATLAITLPVTTPGNYEGKTVTLTADNELGSFIASVSGIVVDENKYNINFATSDIPNDWTDSGEFSVWTKNNAGYISTSGSSNITTSPLVATTGEKLYIQRDGGTLTVKYKKQADEEFATLQALAYTSSKKIDELTIPEGLDAEKILLQFSGSGAKIYRIYGLTEPHEPKMAVDYAETTYNFGIQTADANKELVITNSGNADLEGVTAALTGEDAADYEVALSIPDGSTATITENVATVPAGQTLKVSATLKASTEYKTHTATLTISSTSEGIDDKVITLTGKTRDAAKQYIDFADGVPATWTNSDAWTASSGYVYTSGQKTLRMLPISLEANEKLYVDARQTNSQGGSLTARYTTNNGVSWTEYAIPAVYNNNEFSTYAIDLGNSKNAATAFVEFVGTSAAIDNIYGGTATTAPLIEVTESEAAVATGDNFDFGSNLQAAPAAKVFTLANKGNAEMTAAIAATGDVTVTPADATIAVGESTDITVNMPYNQENVGDKTGAVTITFGGNTFTLNFKGNTIDPTALSEDLASLPAGWYNGGWTVNGSAYINSGVEKELITEQYTAEAGKNVLSFKAKAQNGNEGTLKVYTSTDRKTWSEATEFALTNEYVSQSLTALADGSYYVKFVSLNANIDDLTGLKKILPAPEHDLYVSTSNIPTATKVPETEIKATATVHSLRANETGVYAKLFFDETVVASTQEDPKAISQNGSANFTLTGNVPADEKTYAAKIVVYYSDNSVAFETLTTDVEVQHTRTLAITSFTRTDGDGALDANVNNQVSPAFSVTVQNTGTTAGTPTVKIYQGENVVATATAAAEVAAGATSGAIALTATNMSAGEGGDMAFTAKAFWTAEEPEAKATSASDIVITINAAAPKFALYDSEAAPVANETAYDYGLTRTKIDKVFTIKNEGTKTLQLTSIVAPTGFTATAVTNENKDIAVNGTLDITISLDPSEGLGKKNGNVVITYDVNGTPATFTLAVSGRSVSADTWVEQFDTEIPATWENNGWTFEGQQAYSGGINSERTLMTPRLEANEGEVLTYDLNFKYNGEYPVTVQYSSDRQNWTDYATIAYAQAGEQSFVAPAAGNYYLRFTATRYAQLDNFVGFRLNIPEHDMEITAENVPTTGKQYNTYTATVTLKENAGKDEDITAELWVNNVNVNATANVTKADKNAQTVVTLTWEPETTMDAVESYVKVTYAGGTLQTTPVTLTVAEVYTLDEETTENSVEQVTDETIRLKHTLVAGWNTICLPFNVTDETAIKALFGEDAKVYSYQGKNNSNLNFNTATTMTGGTPYLIHVTSVTDIDQRVDNVTISSLNTTPGTSSYDFKGTYAKMGAGELEGKYGVTSSNTIAKGNSNTTMKGFRAYFENISASARISIFDETTGITRVYDYGEVFGKDDRVYNLNGQHVENAKKGVFIINGKKVVIK